ncbi:MAG: V-type ATP synthase subunit E family protein [Sphingomonadaceae bacterium]
MRRAILQDAEEMARGEIEAARRSSAEEAERAAAEAEEERARILREAEKEAASLRRRIESIAELEGKRKLLDVRERLIREVLERTLAKLREEGGPEPRRTTLRRLVLEAARQAGGGRLVVQTAPADAALLSGQFLEGIREELDREGIAAELQPAEKPAAISGGAIVVGGGGRIVVDNSLEARLARQESSLRGGIWRILSGEALEAGQPEAGRPPPEERAA